MRRFLPFAHRLGPTNLLSGAPFSYPPPAPLTSQQIGDIASIATKARTLSETADTPNASGSLNPELGQLGDDDDYRRWQARTASYHRESTSSRAHTNKNRRNRSGQTRGFHQDQDEVNSHSGNPGNQYASDYHGGVPPSPAASAPAVPPGMRLGAGHNPSRTRTPINQVPSAPEIDSSTALRHTRPALRQHSR